jgi:hypothetical protein
LPDIQHNIMLHCTMCGKGTHVGAHVFYVNHFSRRVAALDTDWFGISRRYICHHCKAAHFEQKRATAAIAQRLGLTVNIDPVVEMTGDKMHYTYMAWNPKTLASLLYLGDKSDMCRGRAPFWAKKEDGCQASITK